MGSLNCPITEDVRDLTGGNKRNIQETFQAGTFVKSGFYSPTKVLDFFGLVKVTEWDKRI